MQYTNQNNAAVSEVVGEMLMIGIVLILVAVFSASLANYLPSERSPSVTIRMANDSFGHVILWHKGGDWVRTDTLRIIVAAGNNSVTTSYTLKSEPHFIHIPDTEAFDLGDNLTVYYPSITGNESVTLATDRAVLFTGKIGGSP